MNAGKLVSLEAIRDKDRAMVRAKRSGKQEDLEVAKRMRNRVGRDPGPATHLERPLFSKTLTFEYSNETLFYKTLTFTE